MEDYQKRVHEERKELDVKIMKLTEHLSNTGPGGKAEKMMYRQLVLMELYSQTLADRIALF